MGDCADSCNAIFVVSFLSDFSSQVAFAVENHISEAKARIMGPAGSSVVLRFTREDTLKK